MLIRWKLIALGACDKSIKWAGNKRSSWGALKSLSGFDRKDWLWGLKEKLGGPLGHSWTLRELVDAFDSLDVLSRLKEQLGPYVPVVWCQDTCPECARDRRAHHERQALIREAIAAIERSR